ncbi:MAG TPA: hypothetical protein PKW63_04215 [Vicinamibacterales bacterium]|jgi:hypothetical protein|nr:hypothetical protein [Acidobacteriota bacterium]HQX80935.1 hypothetical protein [Vicinamibacterales bacterium]
MNALWWVIGTAIAAGVGASVVGLGEGAVRAVWLGIAGPVVMAGTSWTITTRTWAREKAALLPVMLRAFAVKVMCVVAYVVLMVKVVDARPLPFLLSFIGAYLATHLAEAYCLRRLMAAG